MRDSFQMILLVGAMAAATVMTRFLPFWLPARWFDNRLVRTLKDSLPAVILLLLVIYSLKDTPVTAAPWGLPELVSLGVVIVLHLWRRNALISIAGGTALYMILVQTKPWTWLFS